MSKIFSALYYHWVFATKLRRRLIPSAVGDPLHAYMGGILRAIGGRLLKAGGIEDHRHLVVGIPPSISVSDAINKVKSGSTGWMRQRQGRRFFGWQNGYAAFSVGPSRLPSLFRYVENQAEHHRRIGFREELIRFFEAHGLEVDESELDRFCRQG